MNHRYISNPHEELTDLWHGKELGDPFMMRFDGKIYLYPSGAHMPEKENIGIKCWVTEDMVNFTYCGYVATDPRINCAYAPEVCYNAGKFYMVTSPYGSGHYLLRSDSPLGPFEIISENFGHTIDGSIFVDDDGNSYFYRAGHEGIHVHQMSAPDQIELKNRILDVTFLKHWTEGPMVIKRDGRYFLTNTGNHTCSKGYHVDYFVSHEGPDRGYKAMKEQQLLLETRDEYHTLGHSSSCIGPDMDTYYIAYHKNVLNEWNRPDHRSLNIDRLYFNGDRMYTNATWWPQETPVLPICTSRDGEGLIGEEKGLFLPEMAGDTYTTEISITLEKEQGGAYFSLAGEKGACFMMDRQGDWQCRILDAQGEKHYEGHLCKAIDPAALNTLRVSLRKGNLVLYMNGLEILRTMTALSGGKIGVTHGVKPGFIGFSHVAQGSHEGMARKAVPGAWDAIHCLEADVLSEEGELGCAGLSLEKGKCYHYPVSVWKTGKYHMLITMKARREAVTLQVNGKEMCAQPVHTADDQGMEKRYLGVVELTEGDGEIALRAQDDCVIDRIYFQEADDFAPAQVIAGGKDVTEGGLNVIGHKARLSMIPKVTGFTCAEGYGEGYFGGNWRDYQVKAVLHMDPATRDATAGIALRSRRESWHQHQVAAGRIAYVVMVKDGLITLSKQCYDEKVLATAAFEMAYPHALAIICQVEGSEIRVWQETDLGRRLMIHYTDPMALPCGRIGIAAAGDGIGFESLIVEAL
ncbi:MAG: hypothetical protein E7324_01355 [Clostridiales bacterium]|nr:hypothetical protein [Clostridiales bacterium]